MRIFLPAMLLFLTLPVFAQEDEPEIVLPTPVRASSTLRARVYFENSGRPVRRTNVLLMSAKDSPREASGITDALGNLVIKNLKAGKYYAVVNAPGAISRLAYVDFRRTRSDSLEDQFAGFLPIVTDGISDVDTVIPVQMGGVISGRVAYADGGPAIGVKVEILRKVGDEYLPTIPNFTAVSLAIMGGAGMFKTDDRGQYRVSGLPPGEYVVKVSEEMVHPTNSDQSERFGFDSMLFGSASLVSVYFNEGFDLESAQKLKVELGQELGETNIIIPERPLHQLQGKLISAKDKLPIRGARVTISLVGDTHEVAEGSRGDRLSHSGYTDDKGNWTFVELPKGKYKIVAQPLSSEYDAADKAYGTDRSADSLANAVNTAANAVRTATNTHRGNARAPEKPPAPKFAKKAVEFVIEEKDLTVQVIELNFGATIKGTVSIEDDEGLSGLITITVSDEEADMTSSSSIYAEDYDYEADRPKRSRSKEFVIDAVTAGNAYFTIQPSSKDLYVKSAFAGEVDLLKGPISLKDAEVLANVRILLARDSGTLEGTVLDSDDRTVSGFDVTFVPIDPNRYRNPSFYRTARSGANGEFKLKLPPYEHAVVILPKSLGKQNRANVQTWLATAVKSAQTFKIEAGKTTKAKILSSRSP